MRLINEIIIHCADTPNGKPFHNTDIDRWHKERGWQGIGYHYVICVDGTIENGRPLEVPGAHAQGHNQHSIGICMIGKDRFTPAQWEALRLMIFKLKARFSNAKIIGHYQVDNHGKTCPNFDVPAYVADFVPDDRNILI